MISLLLLKKIAELYIIMLAAFFLVKLKRIDATDSSALSRLCINLIYPCMLLNCLAVDLTSDMTKGIVLSVSAAVLINLFLIVFGGLFGSALRMNAVEVASIQYPNAGNMVIPIVNAIFGAEWAIYASAFVIVQNVFIWTFGIKLMSGTSKLKLKDIFSNINVLAILLGAALLIAGLELPTVVKNTVSSVAAMAGPCGMVITGVLLASTDFSALAKYKRLVVVALLRMAVCPALVLAIIKLTHAAAVAADGRSILLISFLAAAAPVASTVTQLSLAYDLDAEYANAISIVTTLCAVITMPIFVYLYEAI